MCISVCLSLCVCPLYVSVSLSVNACLCVSACVWVSVCARASIPHQGISEKVVVVRDWGQAWGCCQLNAVSGVLLWRWQSPACWRDQEESTWQCWVFYSFLSNTVKLFHGSQFIFLSTMPLTRIQYTSVFSVCYVCRGAHTHVCSYVLRPQIIVKHPSIICLVFLRWRTWSSLSTRLAARGVLGILQSWLPQHWDYRVYHHAFHFFYLESWERKSGLRAYTVSRLPTEPATAQFSIFLTPCPVILLQDPEILLSSPVTSRLFCFLVVSL